MAGSGSILTDTRVQEVSSHTQIHSVSTGTGTQYSNKQKAWHFYTVLQYSQCITAPIILSKPDHNSVREIIKNKPIGIKKIIFC